MNFPACPQGNSRDIAWLRALYRASMASQLKSGVGYNVRRGPNGTVLELQGTSGSSADNVKQFLIRDIAGDLVWACQAYVSGEPSGDTVYVLKPENIWAIGTGTEEDPAITKIDPKTGASIEFTYTYPMADDAIYPNTLYRVATWYEGETEKTDEQDVVPYVMADDTSIWAIKANTGIDVGTEETPQPVQWLALSQGWAWSSRNDNPA